MVEKVELNAIFFSLFILNFVCFDSILAIKHICAWGTIKRARCLNEREFAGMATMLPFSMELQCLAFGWLRLQRSLRYISGPLIKFSVVYLLILCAPSSSLTISFFFYLFHRNVRCLFKMSRREWECENELLTKAKSSSEVSLWGHAVKFIGRVECKLTLQFSYSFPRGIGQTEIKKQTHKRDEKYIQT